MMTEQEKKETLEWFGKRYTSVSLPGARKMYGRAIEALEQPEIIHCKDCRYSTDEYGDGECYCKRPSRELVWIGKRWDFFCAAAKMEVENEG